MSERKQSFKAALGAAFPHTIPVFTGFLFLGAAYGMLMQTKGYGALWSVMMSAVAFCGSMQFVAITLLTTVFDPLQAFLLSIMVNARHLFYGISMLQTYKGMGRAKAFLVYTLCDETFSLCYNLKPPEEIDRKQFYIAISLLNYLYWVFGTFVGAVLGDFITFDTTGLDFALTALFVVLFIDQLKSTENRKAGLVGVVATTLSLLLFGSGNLVIPAMLLILLILSAGRKTLCI